jgi:uncharacterized membrane protein YjjB (DUF3815 family)
MRISLGVARLGYAAVVLTAITGGLIIGLQVGGQTLAVSGNAANTPFYVDVIAAGIAAASYPVYFSMPYRMIGWPVAVGMVAHAAHWWALTMWKTNLAVAAFLACLVVGLALVPISHYLRIPFAGIGFASVVALVPGLYVFRMLSGLIQLSSAGSPSLLAATASDGIVAVTVMTAMALGLVIPMQLFGKALNTLHRQTKPG